MADDDDHNVLAGEFYTIYRDQQLKKSEKKKKSLKPKSTKIQLRLNVDDALSSSSCNLQILGNPSTFALYSLIRSTVFEYKFAEACRNLLQLGQNDGRSERHKNESSPQQNLPKVVGVGIETVFELIKSSHLEFPDMCIKALEALLNILEGQNPQSLSRESPRVLDSLFTVLYQLASCDLEEEQPTTSTGSSRSKNLSSLATSCMISLAVARGDINQLLQSIFSLFNCNEDHVFQKLKNPDILKSLQLSIFCVLTGRQTLPNWLTNGIPSNCLVDSFNLKFHKDLCEDDYLSVRSLASDGVYLYLLFNRGLCKIGTGSFGTVKGHIYGTNKIFNGQNAWIGWSNGKLQYILQTPKSLTVEVKTIDTTLLDFTSSLEHFRISPDSKFFSDGEFLGCIFPTPDDGFVVRLFPDKLSESDSFNELRIRLVKRSIEACGPGTWDSVTEVRQIETGLDDEVVDICVGKDFTILRTASGRLLYCGKGASLGQKVGVPKSGKWMELSLSNTVRFIQCSIGHEGIHAILLTEDGTAYFVGTPKRGEDGDMGKPRRVAKACKPKKVTRMDGHEVSFVACNNGTSAFVTRTGQLFMYGKDASPSYCDQTGLVSSLTGVIVTKVAMGKAHIVILTKDGKVYTMGMNNKGQCGRSRPSTREEDLFEDEDEYDEGGAGGTSEGIDQVSQEGFCLPGQHRWKHDQCMVCTVCRECTGYGSACISALRPNRNPGQECGCGVGDAGCEECGSCRTCAREGLDDLDFVVLEGAAGGVDFQMPEIYQLRLNRHSGEEGNEVALPEVQPREQRRKVPQMVRIKVKDKERLTGASSETGIPFSSLVRLSLDNSHIVQIACGLYHSVLLDSEGNVLVFGGNNLGQLGMGDRNPRFSPETVPFPYNVKIVQIAAGSFHTVCLDSDGVVYTAGCNSKSQLGRFGSEYGDANWQEKMLPIDGVGTHLGRRVIWIGASGDTTFLTVEASLISPPLLDESSITATTNAIMIVPPPKDYKQFYPIIIDRRDGSCHQCIGENQWIVTTNFVVLDPVYEYMWAFEPYTQSVKCFNVLASEIRSADFPTNVSLTKPPFALPLAKGSSIYRWQAGANLLACVDTLVAIHIQGLSVNSEEMPMPTTRLKNFSKDDYMTCSRFGHRGGGWGYVNNSAEALRFMCESDIMLGGYGLYGGRGEYTASIKLFDIGVNGGDVEIDGEVIAQSDDIVYETLPCQKFRAMFDEPVKVQARRWYVAWVMVSGPPSDCGADGRATVVTEDQTVFHFKPSKKSINGTDLNSGQIPQLLYRPIRNDTNTTGLNVQVAEPIHILSLDFATSFTPDCVNILTSLFTWCKSMLMKLVPLRVMSQENIFKFELVKYVARSCLRLAEFSTIEAYPLKGAGKSVQTENVDMAVGIGEVRLMLQNFITIDMDDPPLLQYSDIDDVMQQATSTYMECFKVFYPTSKLKWECLKSLAFLVLTQGKSYLRLLMCTIWALWNCRGQLLSIFPVLRNHNYELSTASNFGFLTHSDNGKAKLPQNKILITQMSTRFEADNSLFTRKDWDFWETLDNLLKIVDLSEGLKEEDMGNNIILHFSILIGRLVEELVSHACGIYSDLESVVGQTILCTPCRFARTNQSRTWNTGNGASDAVGFFVDQEGVSIFGACVYCGVGTYTYKLDILQEVEESDSPTQSGQNWITLENINGTFESEECVGDVYEIKFAKPVHIKAGTKYAFRLSNQGGRTCNGDGGVSVLRCDDGTTFTFSACPLSVNGTNQIRGQLPYILYFRNPDNSDAQQKSKAIAEMDARKCALKLSKRIFDDGKHRLQKYGDEFDWNNFETDGCKSLVAALFPYVTAHLQKLATSNPRSCIELLKLIREILPQISAINNKMEKARRGSSISKKQEVEWGVHYAWVESSHPYKPATISHYRVTFPSEVKEMTVEFDPRCVTAQEEDILRILIPSELENLDFHYELTEYIPVMEKYYGSLNWPDKAVVLPGHEVLFSLETASDYVRADKKEYFGFRCLVTGYYEPKSIDGLEPVELELAHLGGICAHELIKRNISLPPVSAEELQYLDDGKGNDEVAMGICMKHHTLFSKGIGLEYFPTVQEALDGIVPLRENSKEREFIADFISRTPNSSGERLSNWLQPESFVDPQKCEIIFPKEKLKRGKSVILILVVRDQYGESVASQNLVVEIKGSPVRSSSGKTTTTSSATFSPRRNYNAPGLAEGSTLPSTSFEPTVKDKMRYQSITMMKEYENFSFEELRLMSPMSKRTTEAMLIRRNNNGTYSATWCPLYVGAYRILATVDGYVIPVNTTVDVEEAPEGPPVFAKLIEEQNRPNGFGFSNKRKFKSSDSAGLRIRNHPTLQSEQLGIIPVNGVVTFVQEIRNDDGIWLKLDDYSFREHCKETNAFQIEGWCLQFNQPLGKTLLLPLEPPLTLPGVQTDSAYRKFTDTPSSNAENSNSAKALRLNGGSGSYIVVQSGVSGHNIRSRPSRQSSSVGILPLGTQFRAIDECLNNEGLWLKLDADAKILHCVGKESEAWALAVGPGDVVYIRKYGGGERQPGYDFSEASHVPKNVFEPVLSPVTFGSVDALQKLMTEDIKKPQNDVKTIPESVSSPAKVEESSLASVPKEPEKLPRRGDSEVSDESPKSGRGRSGSSPFGALQKWLQMSTESLSGHGHAASKSSHSVLEVSKSLLKERVQALSSGSSSKSVQPSVLINSATQTSPEPESFPPPPPEFPKEIQFNIGSSYEFGVPYSPKATTHEFQKGKNCDKRRSRSSSRGGVRDRKLSKSPRPISDEPFTSIPNTTQLKEAIGPGEAQSVRAVFGALLWYAGIIHDAMATASYLKFIQKNAGKTDRIGLAGSASTTNFTPKVKATKTSSLTSQHVSLRQKSQVGTEKLPSQRHSVEVSSSPWLVQNTNPTMAEHELEFLSKIISNGDDDHYYFSTEDDADDQQGSSGDGTGKQTPAALSALQKIWAFMKNNCGEAMLQELFRGLHYKIDGPMKFGATKLKRDRKPTVRKDVDTRKTILEKPKEIQKTGRSFLLEDVEVDEYEFSIDEQCEGCQARLSKRGKSRKSYFGFSTLCDNCIDCQLKLKRLSVNRRSSVGAEVQTDYQSSLSSGNIHNIILNNALFLLQMINTAPEAISGQQIRTDSPNFPVESTFCCLEALGISESQSEDKDDFSDGRCDFKFLETDDMTVEEKTALDTILSSPNSNEAILLPLEASVPRRRKTSNGDNNLDESHNLLSRPSPALQKFMENSKTHGDKEALFKLCGSVLSFAVESHDLTSLKLFLFQAIRKVTCRSYGMQSLAWLLRNVSQPIGLHDLFWWYASTVEPKSDQLIMKQDDADDGWWQIRNHPLNDAPSSIFPVLSKSFYTLLQTMSDIMKFLPIGSPLLEMAVKCWGISFSRKDHRFLHKCKIFHNLSKIMSQFDGENEWSKSSLSIDVPDGESSSSVEVITAFEDLTQTAYIKVSSRMAMCESLTDESTETFWESGEEDSNRAKFIMVTTESSPCINVAGIYLDNVKDSLCRVSSVFVKIFRHPDDNGSILGGMELDPKFVGWIWFSTKESLGRTVRFDIKGPDSNVRVRQVKILGYGSEPEMNERTVTSTLIARQKCERETLRIFRLLSSEVFGKLLSENKHGEEDDGNDLQEHVVGILFSRNKLTHLQKQVCSHIVGAIHRETVKIKEEFTAHMAGSLLEATEDSVRLVSGQDRQPKVGDRYCFEMLSLVLALAGSKVGRSYLSQQSNLIQDLVQLLHSGTPRIQRQVLQVLRKILSEIKPSVFAGIIGSHHDEADSATGARKFGILDLFLGIISKSLQMKARNTGATGKSRLARTFDLSDTFIKDEFPQSYWFLHGGVESALANSVVRLIKDMTEGVFSKDWQTVSKEAISESIMWILTIPAEKRTLENCLCSASFWLSVSSLCVLHKDHGEQLSYPYKNGGAERPLCTNHDDGETVAVIQCTECGDLCTECDRILHLPKKAWNHTRKVCKEEEESISVGLHEGCGRIKLFWLTALADSKTLKALVEFRHGLGPANEKSLTPLQAVGRCRFCGRTGTTGPLALGNICADSECQEFSKTACDKVLRCSHLCGGVKGERTCLPCLYQCAGSHSENLRQDNEDMCMICFTDALGYAPAIQLECGHVFHHHCCVTVLQKKWTGPRITFNFSTCPVCKVDMKHELLEDLLGPIRELHSDVKRKALMRLEYEGMSQIEAIASPGGQFFQNPGQYAMERYAYYLCFKCNKAYFGGDARCDVEIQIQFDPEELVCGGCSDVSQAQLCPKHGTDFLEYKCRYCCSVAVFFCFGTTHFCNGCHDDFQRVTSIPKAQLPSCPAGPRAKQLEGGDECPLHLSHPPTGEEYALGCGVCRNAHTF